MHTQAYAHTSISTHKHMHTQAYAHTSMCAHKHMHTQAYAHTSMCAHTTIKNVCKLTYTSLDCVLNMNGLQGNRETGAHSSDTELALFPGSHAPERKH